MTRVIKKLIFLILILSLLGCPKVAYKDASFETLETAIIKKEHIEKAILEEDFFIKNKETNALENEKSFQIKDGTSKILIVAPHATSHIREGKIKVFDSGTGSLAIMLNDLAKTPIIYTIHLSLSDPNYYDENEFKVELAKLLEKYKPTLVIDLHASHWYRPYDVDIGTIKGKSFLDREDLINLLIQKLKKEGISNISKDFFPASGNETVTKFVSKKGYPCIQLEVNLTLLLTEENKDNIFYTHRFSQLLQALVKFILEVDNNNNNFKGIEK